MIGRSWSTGLRVAEWVDRSSAASDAVDVAGRTVWVWLLTIPVSAGIGAAAMAVIEQLF